MKIWHMIPVDEEELHEKSVACVCNPEPISTSRCVDLDWLDGDLAFEHSPFSPLAPSPKTKWQSYVALVEKVKNA